MPVYVYGCRDKQHPRCEVAHAWGMEPDIPCSVCGKPLHRIPQPFLWGEQAGQRLLNQLDDKYIQLRGKINARKNQARIRNRDRRSPVATGGASRATGGAHRGVIR